MSELNSILLRPMVDSDLDDVLRIESASFPTPWKRVHFEQEFVSPYSYPSVAVDKNSGAVVGFICLQVLFEEAQILDVAVAVEYRQQGIARLLIGSAEDTARSRGAEVMTLEVRESNISARVLYGKLGYCQSGIRTRYYDGVEDAALMEKRL